MSARLDELLFTVPGMSCGRCETAVTREIRAVDGVTSVDVDLAAKLVTVHGESLDRDQIVAAIDEAGYDVS